MALSTCVVHFKMLRPCRSEPVSVAGLMAAVVALCPTVSAIINISAVPFDLSP